MSGGSMDYLYSKVEGARFELNTPLRRAFKSHLGRVAKALRAIEWEDSGDTGREETEKAIEDCLDSTPLRGLSQEARELIPLLQQYAEK